MQIALVEQEPGTFESTRRKVIEIAADLEEKDAIPAVKQQLEYLRARQTTGFWESSDLAALEDLRIQGRGLVQFRDKSKRKIVYAIFEDEIMGVREDAVVHIPRMTGKYSITSPQQPAGTGPLRCRREGTIEMRSPAPGTALDRT